MGVAFAVDFGELLEVARKTASRILRNGPLAVKAAMESIDHGLNMSFEDGCKLEASLFGLLCATAPESQEDKDAGVANPLKLSGKHYPLPDLYRRTIHSPMHHGYSGYQWHFPFVSIFFICHRTPCTSSGRVCVIHTYNTPVFPGQESCRRPG